MNRQQKINYFLNSASRFFIEKRVCPYCASENINEADRKYFFTRLLRCDDCKFQFRFPYDSVQHNKKFYQKEYKQSGLTTDLPSRDKLDEYLKNDFKGTEKDFSFHSDLISCLFKNPNTVSVIDYGANWGYTSFQFIKKGFSVQSFEISEDRAAYGNQELALNIKSTIKELSNSNDVVFSSHVIEHLPDVNQFITLSKNLLKESGVFIAFCPNGSLALQKKDPWLHHLLWGQVHPNFLSAEFYKHIFKNNPYIITTDAKDLNLFSTWDHNQQIIGNLDGVELLVVCMPNKIVNIK